MISTGQARQPAHPFSRSILRSPRALRRNGSRARSLSLLLASTALPTLIFAQPAEAGNPVWTGASSSNWFYSGNWNPGVPNATDTVTIDQVSTNPTVISGAAASALSTYVGAAATGQLTITNGGTLSDSNAAIGFQAGSTGTVTVTGAGSNWINVGDISIGRAGSGTLQVLSGGSVSAVNAYLGDLTSSAHGDLTVSGAGSSFSTSSTLIVGNAGSGSLTIANGGQVTSSGGVGIGFNGQGTVSVDGAGSSWTSAGFFVVGEQAQGTLSITNGASVTSGFACVGFQPGGYGSITVDGAGSSWLMNGLVLGFGGSGGQSLLTIANGGAVTVASGVVIVGFGSFGEIDIGAGAGLTAAAPGTLNASLVQFQSGMIPTGAVRFNHTSSNYVFAPTLAGNGEIIQDAGVTRVTADSSGFTGLAYINGGTLAVTGSLANSTAMTIQTGGTLAGDGTVGGTIHMYDGILAPGWNGTGTLNVQGSLVMSSASTYLVQISGTSTTSAAVTGTAQLAGTVSVQVLSRVSSTTTYTILTGTGGVSGTFDTVLLSGTGLARNARLTYSGTSVLLTLDPGLLSPSLSGATINQRNVAAGIDNALTAGANPSNGFNALLGLTGANLNNALTQASGEHATGVQQVSFDAMDSFVGTMLDPFGHLGNVGAGGGALAFADASGADGRGSARDAFASMQHKAPVGAEFATRWNVWAAGYGGAQNADGNAIVGSHTTSSHAYAVAAGADYRLSPDTIVGFALGGGGTSFNLDSGLGGGHSDLFQAGAFARHYFGQTYLAGALAYGWQDVTTDRTVTIAGLDRLQGRFNANALSGRVEAGHRYELSWVALTPYAAGQATTLFLPGFSEQAVTGTNTFALAYGGKDVTASRSELGLRSDRSYSSGDTIVTLRGRTAWAHNFDVARTATATFETLPQSGFVVNGASQAHDSALLTGAAEIAWRNGFSLGGSIDSELATTRRSVVGKAVARYVW
ncbi:autotransporter domain-containing protein [Bradyrhizobium sp. CCGUVB1N3]|uniref:autotransporter outer membrane beta-barrel domain-containing protein n=1 Tax=Bradyrhizobium sp. CCGUVB1N3 TaxID=2949629 RepID=UPI0020B38E1E|nr:autotransporter domain-containing protein [Bradyrhizobium sp. CCGUVB1N3]MCP3469532.1 autotransporter domain-containing protein [Bradyrhizobium sp. CCGUVB1N3]